MTPCDLCGMEPPAGLTLAELPRWRDEHRGSPVCRTRANENRLTAEGWSRIEVYAGYEWDDGTGPVYDVGRDHEAESDRISLFTRVGIPSDVVSPHNAWAPAWANRFAAWMEQEVRTETAEYTLDAPRVLPAKRAAAFRCALGDPDIQRLILERHDLGEVWELCRGVRTRTARKRKAGVG